MTTSPLLSFETAPTATKAASGFSGTLPNFVFSRAQGDTAQPESPPSVASEVLHSERISFQCDLVITNGNQQELSTLRVTFGQRLRIGDSAYLTGHDASESLRLTLSSDVPATRVGLELKFHPPRSATPQAILPAVELLEHVDPENFLGLRLTGQQRWAAVPEPIPPDHPSLPVGYRDTVDAVARLQRRSGIGFPMPEEITEDDRQEILRGLRLLDGGTVTGTWSEALLLMDPDGAAQLVEASSPSGAVLEFTAEVSAGIANHELPLGQGSYRLAQVAATQAEPANGAEGDQLAVGLNPGSNNQFELVLDEPENEHLADQGPPPRELLERFAGQWVAQRGPHIVGGHESREELLRSLRASGEKVTVWRVPANREEAETTAIGL